MMKFWSRLLMFIDLASPALFKRAVFFSQMDVTLKKIVISWKAPLGTLTSSWAPWVQRADEDVGVPRGRSEVRCCEAALGWKGTGMSPLR